MIANSTNKTYRIRRGCVVGKMEPVKQIKSVNIGELSREETHKQDPLNEEDVKAHSDMKGETVQLVRENSDLFANSKLDLSQTDTVRKKLDTGDKPPIRLKPYETPLNKRKVIDKAIDEMLEAKIIECSQSPWSLCPTLFPL